jgi:hypothetical protein
MTDFTFPPQESASGSDGADRIYQFKAASVPDRISNQLLYYTDVVNTDVALFDLAGATTGDNILVYIESKPNAKPNIAFVLPAEFEYGCIRVVNLSTPTPSDNGAQPSSQQFLILDNAVGSPLIAASTPPGVRSLSSGTSEMLLAPLTLANGSKLTQLNLFARPGIYTTLTDSKEFAALEVGSFVTFYIPGHHQRALYLEDVIANSIQLFADQRVSVSLEASIRSVGGGWTSRGTVSWTTNTNGSVDPASITGTTTLTRTAAVNGFFRQLVTSTVLVANGFMPAARLKLTITGYPDAPATTVVACVAVKDSPLF